MSKAKEAIGTLVNYASSEKEPLRRLVLLKMKTSEFSVARDDYMGLINKAEEIFQLVVANVQNFVGSLGPFS